MHTDATTPTAPTMTLSELAAFLSVSNQALYHLRSQGRGPRGFRVGRQLRLHISEIKAWIASLEADDARRHPPRSRTCARTASITRGRRVNHPDLVGGLGHTALGIS